MLVSRSWQPLAKASFKNLARSVQANLFYRVVRASHSHVKDAGVASVNKKVRKSDQR